MGRLWSVGMKGRTVLVLTAVALCAPAQAAWAQRLPGTRGKPAAVHSFTLTGFAGSGIPTVVRTHAFQLGGFTGSGIPPAAPPAPAIHTLQLAGWKGSGSTIRQ